MKGFRGWIRKSLVTMFFLPTFLILLNHCGFLAFASQSDSENHHEQEAVLPQFDHRAHENLQEESSPSHESGDESCCVFALCCSALQIEAGVGNSIYYFSNRKVLKTLLPETVIFADAGISTPTMGWTYNTGPPVFVFLEQFLIKTFSPHAPPSILAG